MQAEKNMIRTKNNLYFENYEKFFKKLIDNNKIQAKIIFGNANKEFHNRYWFSITEQEGIEVLDKCVIITNSIGNIKEVDILSVTDESQLKQIIRRYTGLYKNAELKLSI